MKKVIPSSILLALMAAVVWLGLKAFDPPAPPERAAAARPAPVAPTAPDAPAPSPPAPTVAPTAALDPEIEAARSEARSLESGGDLAGAIRVIEAKLQQFPSDQILSRDLSHLYSVRGWQSFGSHNLRSARGFFKESLFYWAGNQEALRGMAFVSMEEQDREAAEDWIRQYFAAGGDRPEVYSLQGKIAYEAERMTEAHYYFEISLALDRNQPDVASMLEKIRREQKVERGFQRRESRHFVIKYEGRELPEVWRMVERVCEDAYLEVGRRLGHYPALPVTVILYTDRQFQDATRVPAWAEAIFDGKIRIPAKGLLQPNQELSRIVMHEYAHAAVHDLSRGRAPIWLHEGIAQFYEGTPTDPAYVARRIVAAGGPLPLSGIEGMFVNMPQKQAELAYIESRLAAIYINDNHGPFALRETLRRLGDGDDTPTAIRRATGRYYQDLDQEFREWVVKLAGQ